MKTNEKRILRTVIALMLVISSILSLFSCTLGTDIFNGITGGDLPGGNNVGGNNDGEEVEGDNGDSENNNNSSLDGYIPSDSTDEFYPGSGEGSTENISGIRRTLLSTVIVIANFSYTPSVGSGVIYQLDKESGDAYIITNYHVLRTKSYGLCDSISVYLYGMENEGYAISASLLGGSVTNDIAVLKVENSEVLKNSYAEAATLADSEGVRVFDTVYAVGNPEGYGLAATKGIVSVESEDLDMEGADGSDISIRVMRIDAAINAGNSGGGLYDGEGRLIGIVTAKRTGSDIDNMAYATPSNLVKNLADNIIYYCDGTSATKVKRVYIGITITANIKGLVIDPDTGDFSQAEIVEVVSVTSGSAADGLIKIGDVINGVTVDGVYQEATGAYLIPEHLLTARAGSTVVVNITRGEETLDITLEITEASISEVK